MTELALFEVPERWWRRRRCPVCGVALSIEHEFTYVVQRQWWVKIGATNRPRKRMNELARVDWKNYCLWPAGMDWTEPLIKHAMIAGDVEHELHQRFAEQHAIGEWFLIDDELRQWIADRSDTVTEPQRPHDLHNDKQETS